MGTTVAALAFDMTSALATGSASLDRELYRAATFVLMVGQLAVPLAVLTGWWDRRRLTRKETAVRAATNAHAWLMLAFGAVSFFDLVLRRNVHPHAVHTPAIVLATTITLGLLAVLGGTLGGSLTFDQGLGVEEAER